MIERIYLKNALTFNEVELELTKGLILFTGPSGAGKSVLMDAILSSFGLKDPKAQRVEVVIDYPMPLENYGLENDDIIILHQIKKEKVRFFINNQSVSKKNLKSLCENFLLHLSLKKVEEFSNDNLLSLLDAMQTSKEFFALKSSFDHEFITYKETEKALNTLLKEEKEMDELKAFLRYEIEKIESISPKKDEFEVLMQTKKEISKIEKIRGSAEALRPLFDYEDKVTQFLTLIEKESGFFDETMNELKSLIEDTEYRIADLESQDIEEVLDRLEVLQSLIKRFGSIEEALAYLNEKKEELSRLENIAFEKKALEKKHASLYQSLTKLAEKISAYRQEAAHLLEEKLSYFLEKLYLNKASLLRHKRKLYRYGFDEIDLHVGGKEVELLSTGEFNRVRLALLAAKIDYEKEGKVLFLDEIDANLSGEESMSVAEVLSLLSQTHQIFAISHQPQLTSKADLHFLVQKEEDISTVSKLSYKERVEEISRMISGKTINKEAKEYAQKLLG